jgi:prepilin-type N-terminal cleavage/methylation domain-containing protein
MKFTLIEMLAVITITSLLLTMVLSIKVGSGVNSKQAQVGS